MNRCPQCGDPLTPSHFPNRDDGFCWKCRTWFAPSYAEPWFDDDSLTDEEVYDAAMSECGQRGDGTCSMAGSEFCDWSCAIANPHKLKDLKEHLQLNGGGRR